jgi:hypothetical protein
MQVDLDFYKNKIRMTDTVRAVSFFTAVDSVESEQAIGQFMTEEPLETTILRTEREITGMNVRFTRYKEWSARWARKKAVTEALDERFQEATGRLDYRMRRTRPRSYPTRYARRWWHCTRRFSGDQWMRTAMWMHLK